MLEHIAMLEGAAERRMMDKTRGDDARAAAQVRSKLQDARLAEQEVLRLQGESPVDVALAVDTGLERGRAGVADEIMRAIGAQAAPL